jgi:hypothetical protein
VLASGLAGCGGGEPPPADASPSAAKPPTNRIAIPPTVRSNLGMTFAEVQRRQVEQTTRIPGAFELLPKARREYRLSLPGTVQMEVDQFDQVSPGDLLYRIRSPRWPELQHEIIEAEQDIQSAVATIAVARARQDESEVQRRVLQERLSSLVEAGVRNAAIEADLAGLEAATPRLRAEVQQAETVLENARRARAHAVHRASAATGIPEAELLAETSGSPAYRGIDLIDVRASEAGVVESLGVTDGGYAEPPTLAISTVQPEQVRLRGVAMQGDLPRIGSAPTGRIVSADRSEGGVEAAVTLGLEADPAHRTIAVLGTPDTYHAWMRPGVSAFLELAGEGSAPPALAIPRAAVVQDGLARVFFRRDPADPNSVIRVEADLGTDDGRWVVVNSGVALGDEVVLGGAYELNLASQTGGLRQKGGHFHADGTFHAEDH